ncbi:glycoside hydrolase family 16 protein [Botryobasidium botryosum FD-172 SS1]|uniref:Glycoside hydrolase family 16 protein n=1 Tax=Botryobasidium botryosum (strain FD-172 SS1) TaxID=930990 RepID=A0A067M920_BOTB1|nr:glycoside hydrolase family 16 protein [Botryobasidium botryosum FD-172 SS1]
MPPGTNPFTANSGNGSSLSPPVMSSANPGRRVATNPGAGSSSPLSPMYLQQGGAGSSSSMLLSPGAQAASPFGSPTRALRTMASDSSLGTRYSPAGSTTSLPASISDKFSLNADPTSWGFDLVQGAPEPDDHIHNPDPKRDRKNDQGGTILTSRGIANLGCLFILAAGLITLFAGFPLMTYFLSPKPTTLGGYNIGGINASGQVPVMHGSFAVIDPETPIDAHTKASYADGSQWQLVFSDEFNTPGRTFYPGDDPYWEAVDMHYWGTNNLEWYDPVAITTADGALKITLSKIPTHNLSYQGGMMTSWNKFCFTGGMIETAVSLPGTSAVYGLWPAVWTMGNLGRAGYGASLEGMWPYTYDACDVGTLANQTLNGLPKAATINGDPSNGNALSYLPGQRISACTCPGESHPGPKHSDGTFVGRGAPEIDIFEALVDSTTLIGQVSQSCQWAPFNNEYKWANTSTTLQIYNATETVLNPYIGGAFQQVTSGLSFTNQSCYTQDSGCYSVYGFEYKPGNDGYITWINNNKAMWTVHGAGLVGDPVVQISQRPVPQEPMYIIANLGMSPNFGPIDFAGIQFPVTMSIDYIRVYQPADSINIGCDPPDFPTQAYINEYLPAYTDVNLTTWKQAGHTFPKNKLTSTC